MSTRCGPFRLLAVRICVAVNAGLRLEVLLSGFSIAFDFHRGRPRTSSGLFVRDLIRVIRINRRQFDGDVWLAGCGFVHVAEPVQLEHVTLDLFVEVLSQRFVGFGHSHFDSGGDAI